jgi:hypothetical protein
MSRERVPTLKIASETFHLIWRWIFEPRWRGRILSGLFGWRAAMRGGGAFGAKSLEKRTAGDRFGIFFTAFFLCTKQSVFSAKELLKNNCRIYGQIE